MRDYTPENICALKDSEEIVVQAYESTMLT
jgi:hypothetical protein